MASLNKHSLQVPSDWPLWFAAFKRRARGLHIYELVDLEDISEQAEDEHPLRKPTQPNRIQIAKDLGLGELHHDVLETYKILLMEYKAVETRYLSDLEAYRKLDQWVLDTVDAKWLNLVPEEDSANLRAVLRFLKARVSLSEEEEARQARNEYKSILRKASTRPGALVWYRDWEEVRLRAEALKIPEVQGNLAIHDFLAAVKNFLPHWVEQMQTQVWIQEEEGKDLLSIERLGNLFLRAQQNQTAARPAARGNFAISSPGCPCGRDHPYPPSRCNTVHKALTGQPWQKTTYPFPKRVIKECQQALKAPEWEELVREIKAGEGATGNSGMDEDDNEGWPPMCK